MTEESKYLSEIELFYSPSIFLARNQITLEKTEFHHAVNVMRHHEGDNIYITNGEGVIFEGEITNIFEKHLLLNIIRRIEYDNKFGNVFFCFPILGQRDRFESVLEKSADLE